MPNRPKDLREPSAGTPGTDARFPRDYEAEIQPRISAIYQLIFVCIWSVISVCVILIIDSRFGWLGPMRWLTVAGFAFLILLAWVALWPICCTKGFQRWSIRDGVIAYETPTPILGESFRARLEEVDAIWREGDGDFAFCRLKATGHTYRFSVRTIEGQVFFALISDWKKAEQASSKTPG